MTHHLDLFSKCTLDSFFPIFVRLQAGSYVAMTKSALLWTDMLLPKYPHTQDDNLSKSKLEERTCYIMVVICDETPTVNQHHPCLHCSVIIFKV